MTFAQRILQACSLRKDALGLLPKTPLPPDERDKVLEEMVQVFIGEAREQFLKEKRPKKEQVINEKAEPIFRIYPVRKGGRAALVAISGAIQEDGFTLVLEKTTEYATAVARWTKEECRYIPLPATWYNQRRYKLDDSKEWFKGRGDPTKATTTTHIPAPTGWILWATNKRHEWEKENPNYTAPGESAITAKNFFTLPASWQQECREQLIQQRQA